MVQAQDINFKDLITNSVVHEKPSTASQHQTVRASLNSGSNVRRKSNLDAKKSVGGGPSASQGASKLRQSIARSSNADLEDVVNDQDGLRQRSSLVPK